MLNFIQKQLTNKTMNKELIRKLAILRTKLIESEDFNLLNGFEIVSKAIEALEKKEKNEVIFRINWEDVEEMDKSHICKYCKCETTQSDEECYAKPLDHSELIVEMTKANVAANITSGTSLRIKDCIEVAEEVINQLKQKGYLK